MVQSCCISGCIERSSKESSVSFHRFPIDPCLKEQWVLATRRQNFTPSKQTVICSRHFHQNDFSTYVGQRRLHKHAVPSIFDFLTYTEEKTVRKRKRRSVPLAKHMPIGEPVMMSSSRGIPLFQQPERCGFSNDLDKLIKMTTFSETLRRIWQQNTMDNAEPSLSSSLLMSGLGQKNHNYQAPLTLPTPPVNLGNYEFIPLHHVKSEPEDLNFSDYDLQNRFLSNFRTNSNELDMHDSKSNIVICENYKIEKKNIKVENTPISKKKVTVKEEIDIEEHKPGYELSKNGNSLSKLHQSKTGSMELICKSEVKQEKKVYMCAHCSYETKDRSYFMHHYNLKHKVHNDLYKCTHCAYETKIKHYLVLHYNRKHKEQTEVYSCDQCPYETRVRKYILRHYNRTHKMKGYKSSDSPYEIKVKNILVGNYNPQGEMYKCVQCAYETPVRINLVRHYNRKHRDEGEVYKCSKCDYETKIKEYIIKHNQCKHKVQQTDVYKCAECSYGSTHKRYLRKHIKCQHRRDPYSYSCTQCPYKSKTKYSLERHYECKHDELTHVFKCSECKYVSRIKRYLVRHYNLIHKEQTETFRCSECEYETRARNYLVEHYKRKHMMKPEEYKLVGCPFEGTEKKVFDMIQKS